MRLCDNANNCLVWPKRLDFDAESCAKLQMGL